MPSCFDDRRAILRDVRVVGGDGEAGNLLVAESLDVDTAYSATQFNSVQLFRGVD